MGARTRISIWPRFTIVTIQVVGRTVESLCSTIFPLHDVGQQGTRHPLTRSGEFFVQRSRSITLACGGHCCMASFRELSRLDRRVDDVRPVIAAWDIAAAIEGKSNKKVSKVSAA